MLANVVKTKKLPCLDRGIKLWMRLQTLVLAEPTVPCQSDLQRKQIILKRLQETKSPKQSSLQSSKSL